MAEKEIATFAAGCFWQVEEMFREMHGVISTRVGYSGGKSNYKNPSYGLVSTGGTGHAEAVEIIFNPKKVTYEKLLEIFWNNHDPTTPNKQGPDVGTQYRSVIFYHTEEQKGKAEKSLEEHQKKFEVPIVTQIVPAKAFYEAEDYHQKYLLKRGMKYCHV